MCELLIAKADQISPDFYRNLALPKRGDVIHVAADNAPWGEQERLNPDWRIIRLPGIGKALVEDLLSEELNTAGPPGSRSRTLQYRGFTIDRSKLPAQPGLATYWNDDTRSAPGFTITGGAGGFRAAIVQRPVVPDPEIIG